MCLVPSRGVPEGLSGAFPTPPGLGALCPPRQGDAPQRARLSPSTRSGWPVPGSSRGRTPDTCVERPCHSVRAGSGQRGAHVCGGRAGAQPHRQRGEKLKRQQCYNEVSGELFSVIEHLF